jgi:hypothetical protein
MIGGLADPEVRENFGALLGQGESICLGDYN